MVGAGWGKRLHRGRADRGRHFTGAEDACTGQSELQTMSDGAEQRTGAERGSTTGRRL